MIEMTESEARIKVGLLSLRIIITKWWQFRTRYKLYKEAQSLALKYGFELPPTGGNE